MVRSPLGILAAVAFSAALAATPASAAAPPNDDPWAPGVFESYTTANGTPTEQYAVAQLAEAHPDGGVPRCLGPASFERTVWYRIPHAAVPRELTVEAMGRTLDVVDLAAFVQPWTSDPPPPPPPPPPPAPEEEPGFPAAGTAQSDAPPLTREPNACAGAGLGGSEAAEEPTSAVSLHVPAGHPLLVQVARRGRAGDPADEEAVLSLAADDLMARTPPAGDRGERATTPRAPANGARSLALTGATITEEDPAQPACPSLGSVWRRVVPPRSGKRLIRVTGSRAQTLTVFAGRRPTGDNALDCVNRAGGGALEMLVRARKRRPLWIRVGTDATPLGARAGLRVASGRTATVIDGGPGGSDPTTGGPGGGLPEACQSPRADRARVRGPRLRGTAGSRNAFRRVPVTVAVRRAPLCDAEIELVGPRGRVYARGRVGYVRGRRTVRLPRLLTFRPGAYRLRVTALDWVGERVKVRTRVRGRLG